MFCSDVCTYVNRPGLSQRLARNTLINALRRNALTPRTQSFDHYAATTAATTAATATTTEVGLLSETANEANLTTVAALIDGAVRGWADLCAWSLETETETGSRGADPHKCINQVAEVLNRYLFLLILSYLASLLV
jgi:hypothetical protein